MAETDVAKRQPTEYESATNVKETLESILVAFILAFIFRAFIVEAFVIPTGSMGPTLLGAHTHWRCPDCGYEWDANFSNGKDDDSDIPSMASGYVYNLRCPNCGFRINPKQTTSPPVYFGDRILVLKYQYIFHEPERWDVVVFKAPTKPVGRSDDFSLNFIKRLVGLPGDTLMVLDGGVYVKRQGESDYHIASKPRAAQEALWRNVCNVDYMPQKLNRGIDPAWKLPWQPAGGNGWNTDSRVFSFSNPHGAGTLRFDPDADPDTFPLTDLVGYDQTKDQLPPSDYSDVDSRLNDLVRFNVSDVKLDFFYERKAGNGPLRLRLTKYDDAFTAIITGSEVRLEKSTGNSNASTLIAKAPLPENGDKPRHIEYTNVDYKVTVRVDGQDLVWTDSSNYAPDIAKLVDNFRAMKNLGSPSRPFSSRQAEEMEVLNPRPHISIAAENQTCDIHHLQLLRGAYYTPYMPNGSRTGWALHATPDDPEILGSDDYFVMGDNSPMSYDARFWDYDVDLNKNEELFSKQGRVPRRFMIGRAFFVYWPAGSRVFGNDSPGFVPNFGDMRFIH